MAKAQAPKETKEKVKTRRPRKPLEVLTGATLEAAVTLQERLTETVQMVEEAKMVPTPHLRAIRKEFFASFSAVVKARRGDVLGRKRERLERLIAKASAALEALQQ